MKRLRAFLLIAGAASVASAAGRLAWRERDRLPPLATVVARARDAVAPGPLAPPHRGVPELENCAACHSPTRSISDQKCLTCHPTIGDRRASRGGFHGARLDGDCAGCHRDHGDSLIAFDRATFQHDLARFELRGAHADLDCEACHTLPRDDSEIGPTAFHYLRAAPASCAACHASPHVGSTLAADPDCARCHGTAPVSWSIDRRAFDHSGATGFALDSTHGSLDCRACHAIPEFPATPRDCADCHRAAAEELAGRVVLGGRSVQSTPSPHAGIVACDRCHDGSKPRETELDYAAKCTGCHNERYAYLLFEQRALFSTLAHALADRADADALQSLSHHDFAAAYELIRQRGVDSDPRR